MIFINGRYKKMIVISAPEERYVVSVEHQVGFCRSHRRSAVYMRPPPPPPPATMLTEGQGVFVIINYAETRRLNVILTSAMVSLDPPPVIIESILQRKFHRD